MTRDLRPHDPRLAINSMDLYELNVAMAAAARVAARLAAANGDKRARVDSGERAAALAEIRCVEDCQWWASASAQAIGRAYAKARSWRDDSPEAASAEDLIRAELRARYGIDADEAAGPPQLVQDQYERYELERLRASNCRASVRDDDPPGR